VRHTHAARATSLPGALPNVERKSRSLPHVEREPRSLPRIGREPHSLSLQRESLAPPGQTKVALAPPDRTRAALAPPSRTKVTLTHQAERGRAHSTGSNGSRDRSIRSNGSRARSTRSNESLARPNGPSDHAGEHGHEPAPTRFACSRGPCRRVGARSASTTAPAPATPTESAHVPKLAGVGAVVLPLGPTRRQGPAPVRAEAPAGSAAGGAPPHQTERQAPPDQAPGPTAPKRQGLPDRAQDSDNQARTSSPSAPNPGGGRR
jgi:hypothetical protein